MKKLFLMNLIILFASTLFCQNMIEEVKEKFKNFTDGDILISKDYTYKTGNFEKSNEAYSNALIGVYYDDNDYTQKDIRKYKNPIKISGFTYVKYNNENGTIKAGDPVTSSSTPGEAMKANQSGMILGVALEDPETSSKNLLKIRLSIQYLNF